RHRPQHRVLQAVANAEAAGPAVPQAGDALPLAAQPEVALAVLEDGADSGGGRVLVAHQFAQAAGLQAGQARGHGYPEVAVAVLVQLLDGRACQRLTALVPFPGIALAVEQAFAGAGPDAALGLDQPGHHGVAGFLGQGQYGHVFALDAIDLAQAADPEAVLALEQAVGGAGQGMQQLQAPLLVLAGDDIDAILGGHRQAAVGQHGDAAGIDGRAQLAFD